MIETAIMFGNIIIHIQCLSNDWQEFKFHLYTTVIPLNQNIHHVYVSNRLLIYTTVILESESPISTTGCPKMLGSGYKLGVLELILPSHSSSLLSL